MEKRVMHEETKWFDNSDFILLQFFSFFLSLGIMMYVESAIGFFKVNLSNLTIS